MAQRPVNIESSWQALLGAEFEEQYMAALSAFLRAEKQKGKRIFPPGDSIFAAFDHTPVAEVKVVVIGQDPYHGTQSGARSLLFGITRYRTTAVAEEYLSGD